MTPPDEPAPPGRATPTEAASALDALGAGVLVVDRAGQIVLSNPRAAEILGRPEASLSGRALVDVLAPLATLLAAPGQRAEVAVPLPGGGERSVGVSLTPFVPAGHGAADVHHVCLFQDLTSARALHQERDRLLQLAAVSGALPSILHEMRNPLAAIATMVEVLLEEPQASGIADDLHAILTEVRRALLGLQGLGAVGRSLRAAGHEAIDHAVEETVRVVQSAAAQSGIRVHHEAAFLPLLPFDPAVMRAIVFNLVSNAVHACATGGEVTVRAALRPNGLFELVVSDTGTGMSPDVAARCTELFFTTKRHGSGIGLALCDRAVRGAGGVLTVESALGRGTTFTVHVPVVAPPG
ncbi:ATP-binding protein [Myxococcota bacterium]|nr:ATP-binding protein [Myxococcota bacterium]